MNRREALAAGGLAGVALGTGCAPRMIAPGGFDASGALEELDRSLAQARCIAPSLTGGAFTCAPNVPAERFHDVAGQVSHLCEEGARALMVAAFFHGLAPDERLHPEIQTRMRAELPRIGGAVAAMAGAVEQVGPRERRAIQEYLRKTPGLEDRITTEVDGHAERSEAPFIKRVQFRRQLGDLAWRMRQQPADVVIDEVLGKFRKAEAYQRAHAGELLALAMPPGQPSAPAGSNAWWAPGGITILVGLGTLGLGLVGGFVAGTTGNIGLATLAAVVFALGVLIMVIGLVILAVGGISQLAAGSQNSQPTAPAPAPEHPPEPMPL